MGNWIKQNKFEAGLLALVVLAVIGAYLLGGKQGTIYAEHRDSYAAAAQQLSNLESKSPYPTEPNEQEYEGEIEEYRKVIEGLQEKLLAYRPAEFKQIPPSEFTDKLNAKRDALARRYADEGIVFPGENWQLGFERYTTTPPRDPATAYLSYQLDAHDWLFGALADAKPSELINVVRKELPVESGGSMDGESAGKGRGGPPAKPFHVLPLELTFKAPEPAVRAFLARLSGDDQHFFVIRAIRISNEKRDQPPKKDDVDFDRKPKAGDSPFDSTFDLIVPEGETPAPEGDAPAPEGDAPAPEGDAPADEGPLFPAEPAAPEEAPPAVAEGVRILGQILGAEEVFVFLQLDLLLFKEKENSGLPMPRGRTGS